ncbi:MAG: T9SS type A sorting domain-containing protein [Candidatus Fermentibacteraceae bacterium]|nr:T9SS type A sorting domain-containing protein [Candidatus Fermentibacteraceae bacterium]
MEQTDWSGGPGVQGPAYWFDDTFWDSQLIDWSTAGRLTLMPDWLSRGEKGPGFGGTDDYPDSGSLVSSLVWIPMGTDWEIVWGDIEWTSIEPDSTDVSFQLRTGMTPETMGGWTDPITESGTYLGDILPDTILLLQYRAILNSTDSSVTPELESVLIWGWYPGGIEEGRSGGQGTEILEVQSNPASALTVCIHVLEPGGYDLQVFDISGRLQGNIVHGFLGTGDYSFDLDRLEDGMYILRLDSPGGVILEKATVLGFR